MHRTSSFRSYWTLILVLILGLVLVLTMTTLVSAGPDASPAAAKTYHVAKTGDGSDGLTWATAFTDVQDALTEAADGDEIWVATGVYTPGADVSDSFLLVSGVGMYGGFAGGETGRDQRDPEANVTVLSGDIDGDDNNTNADGVVTDPDDIQSSNSRMVVSATLLADTTILDGFTVTAGDAPDSSGGLYNTGGSPALVNMVFRGNRAQHEAGALGHGNGDLTLVNAHFANNKVTSGDGGAIYSMGTMRIEDSSFVENSASRAGGAIQSEGTVRIEDSSFVENSASRAGGVQAVGGTVQITNCTFVDNMAGEGGAIDLYGVYMTIRDSTFAGNLASGTDSCGGAVHLHVFVPLASSRTQSAPPNLAVAGSTFIGNRATDSSGDSHGGAICNENMRVSVANSTFYDNEATQNGGAIYNGNLLSLANCTLSHNSAGGNGDGIFNQGTLHLTNTIIANTENGVDCFNHGSNAIATNINNLIEKTESPHMCGTPALTGDPKLSPPSDNGGKTQTMALNSDSPALDAGDDAACAAAPINNLDQRGVARPQGAHCDIGAYEAVQAVRCYVHNDDTAADYESYDAVAVQQAVDEASDGHLLKVAGYCQGVELREAAYQTIYISRSLTLQGGYTYTNWLAAPDLEAYRTTLDANSSGRVVFVTNTQGVTLSHLVITRGKTPDKTAGGNGGGIHSNGSLALAHSIVVSNATGYEANDWGGDGGYGAGIYGLGSLSVSYSTVTDNVAGHGTTGGYGGGIYVSGTLSLDHSTVRDNEAGLGGSGYVGGPGGGLYIRGEGTITHSTIRDNISGSSKESIGQAGNGGGIYNMGRLTIHNSTISGNVAAPCLDDCGGSGGYGGGIYSNRQVTLTHSTVTGNTASDGNGGSGDGGGIYVAAGSASLQNSILAGNIDAGGEAPDCDGTLTSLDYNLIEATTGCTIDGTTGNDITGQDAKLSPLGNHGGPAAPLNGEPTWTQALKPDSPALNYIPAGTSGCGSTFVDDQRDLPQPAGGACDIGAVEMQAQSLTGVPAGDGSGTVGSDPAGIACTTAGGDCTESYDYGTPVTLTAVADSGSSFTGWSGGGCTGTDACQVLMDQARTVTATFALDRVSLSVSITGPGSGAVTSQPPGIDCDTGTCQGDFGYGTTITLTAAADAGSVLDAWSGDCSGSADGCALTITTTSHVTATFLLGGFDVYLPYVTK